MLYTKVLFVCVGTIKSSWLKLMHRLPKEACGGSERNNYCSHFFIISSASRATSPSPTSNRPAFRCVGLLFHRIFFPLNSAATFRTSKKLDLPKNCGTSALFANVDPDILCIIFRHVIIQEEIARKPEGTTYGWIYITHVCKHWRDVALHNPLLWSKINASRASPEWPCEILRRSQEAPLDVTLASQQPHLYNESMEKFVKHVLDKHLRRIRSLSLKQTYGRVGDIDLLKGPAPLLERLRIECHRARGSLPDDFYECFNHPDTRLLQRLELKYVPFDWSRVELSHLTHLQFSNTTGRSRMHVTDFPSALTHMVLLEDLVVEDALLPPVVPMCAT